MNILQFIESLVKKLSKNKFYRFSRELMILGTGRKSKKKYESGIEKQKYSGHCVD